MLEGEPVEVMQRVLTTIDGEPGPNVTVLKSDLETLVARTRRDAARERIDQRARDALDPQGKFANAFLKEHGEAPKWADRAREALRIREISEPFFKLVAREEVFLFANRVQAGESVTDAIAYAAQERGLQLDSMRTILQRERGNLRRLVEAYGEIAKLILQPTIGLLAILDKLPGGS